MSSNPIILLPFIPHAIAYTTFSTTCTHPNRTTNFVDGPDTRGTLDILWSALFTIVACTWSVQFLNVPEQREGRDPGWRGDLSWLIKNFLPQLKWCLITIIAPELLLGKSVGEFASAREILRQWRLFAQEDGVPASSIHIIFANMGGFVIKFSAEEAVPVEAGVVARIKEGAEGETVPEGAAVAEAMEDPDPRRTRHLFRQQLRPRTSYTVTAADILGLRRNGTLRRLPDITIEQIRDKEKGGDGFTRAIAVAQILWVVIQVIARSVRGLSISQLEIAVSAFAAFAVAIYAANYNKPKGVHLPMTLITFPALEFNEVVMQLESSSFRNESYFGHFLKLFTLNPPESFGSESGRPSDIPEGIGSPISMYVIGISAILFGGIHVAAWNFTFPTRIEQIMWRVMSLYATASLPVIFLLLFTDFAYLVNLPSFVEILRGHVIGWGIFFYTTSRIFILVEVFRSLCFLPPDAYIATWASNLPHVG